MHNWALIQFLISEMKNEPDKKWPLGNSDDSYKYIDLLITDQDEALRLSNESTTEAAITFFIDKKVPAFIYQWFKSCNSIFQRATFQRIGLGKIPCFPANCQRTEKTNKSGDTTGAGDNFVGGVIVSIVNQLQPEKRNSVLRRRFPGELFRVVMLVFTWERTYFEQENGEKLNKIKPYYEFYQQQING